MQADPSQALTSPMLGYFDGVDDALHHSCIKCLIESIILLTRCSHSTAISES